MIESQYFKLRKSCGLAKPDDSNCLVGTEENSIIMTDFITFDLNK